MEAKKELMAALDTASLKKVYDWGKLKNIMKDALSDYCGKKFKRRPEILPIIMGVDE